MRKIVELNTKIENSFKRNIQFHLGYKNCLFNNHWVNELGNSFFKTKSDSIKKMIDENIDLDDEKSIKFLKIIGEDLENNYEELLNENYHDSVFMEKFASFDYITNDETLNPPESKCVDIEFSEDNDILAIILNIISNQHELNEFNFYDGESGVLEKKDEIYDLLYNKYVDFTDEKIEVVYTIAHLSYVLSAHRKMIGEILEYINNLIIVINKFQIYDSDEVILGGVDGGVKLEFAMSKQDIAIFFHTLHELKIVKTDTDNIHNSQTKLKAFIDNSNIYYNFKNTLTKVGNIKKQFTDLNNKDINNKEIEHIESLIEKFQTRLEEVKSRK